HPQQHIAATANPSNNQESESEFEKLQQRLHNEQEKLDKLKTQHLAKQEALDVLDKSTREEDAETRREWDKLNTTRGFQIDGRNASALDAIYASRVKGKVRYLVIGADHMTQ